MKYALLPALCAIAIPAIVSAQSNEMGILSRSDFSSSGIEQIGDSEIAAMRDAALEGDTLAFSITEGLTTEVGRILGNTRKR